MEYLLGETRFYFAQCVFNVKCHYAAYERYRKTRSRNQWIAWFISLCTIGILVVTIVGWECQSSTLLQVCSFLGLVSSAASLAFEMLCRQDLTELMCCHKQAAQGYMNLRDALMDKIRLIKQGGNLDDLSESVQMCLHDYDVLGAYALDTTADDYAIAQKKLGLKSNDEEFTWSDLEIDKFLPKELREGL